MPVKALKRPATARKTLKTKWRDTKTLKRLLDETFSKYIRTKYLKDGYNTCYCGVKVNFEESDASHYIPRGCLNLRWSEKNVYPSCRACNRFRGGNLQAYAVFLERTYGTGILQELEQEKRKIVKLSSFWYETEIQKYKALL